MTSFSDLRRLREQVGEVIASHARAKDIREFARFESPANFQREVLRGIPWEKQVEMGDLVRDHPRTVVVTATGIGKDWNVAGLALWWAYGKRGLCILTGPTERPVKQILMREVRKQFTRAPELPGELYAMELRVDESGECGILAFTSDNADRLTGFHHPRLLIRITEGQGVGEDAFEAAQACTTGPENRLLVCGNPTRPTGPFYRVAQSDTWAKLTIRADEHPNVITGREEIPGATSGEWIELMREEYGEDSSIYGSRVLAKFPSESVEGLIRREWLEAAFDRWDSGEMAEIAWQYGHVLALDVSRSIGGEECLLTDLQGGHVHGFTQWRAPNLETTADKVIAYGDRIAQESFGQKWARGWGGQRPVVHVDEEGVGGGAVDFLRSRGYPTRGFKGSHKPVRHYLERYLNQRAEAHWRFRELLQEGKVAIPRNPMLEEESLSIEWTLNAAGKIQVLGKDLVKKQIGRSPDRLASLIIALYRGKDGVRNETVVGTFYV